MGDEHRALAVERGEGEVGVDDAHLSPLGAAKVVHGVLKQRRSIAGRLCEEHRRGVPRRGSLLARPARPQELRRRALPTHLPEMMVVIAGNEDGFVAHDRLAGG